MSVLEDGLSTGAFATSRPLPADRGVLRWPDPQGEAAHYWRVRTRVGDGWATSAAATFMGPGCVGVDLQSGG